MATNPCLLLLFLTVLLSAMTRVRGASVPEPDDICKYIDCDPPLDCPPGFVMEDGADGYRCVPMEGKSDVKLSTSVKMIKWISV